ncbi:hypothetical protein HDZ31DRAFT_86016 [Schizophyllum fasciatum]
MRQRTSSRLQPKTKPEPMESTPPLNDADRVKELEAHLAQAKAEHQLSSQHWAEERARLRTENERIRRSSKKAIAKLRAEVEGLRVQLAAANPRVHEERGSDVAHSGNSTSTDSPSTVAERHMTLPRGQMPFVAPRTSASNPADDDEKYTLHMSIKKEVEDGIEIEEFREVTLSKSETGDMLWDLGTLGLGPEGTVDDMYQRSFERKVVSWAFGGGHQATHHNQDALNLDTYSTYHPKWNPQLPTRAGAHGIAFGNGPVKELLPIFVRTSSNQWRYTGHYSRHMRGVLDSTQLARSYLANVNAALKEEATARGTPFRPVHAEEGDICAAFADGRLTMSFAILEFTRFERAWFEQLLAAEAAGRRIAPEAEKAKDETGNRKRTSSSDEVPPAKKRKGKVSKTTRVQKDKAEDGNDEDSDVQFVSMKKAPAPSKRQLRSATQALPNDTDDLGSDGEEGQRTLNVIDVDDSDEDSDNDEA